MGYEKEVGKFFENERKRRNITRKEISDISGVSPNVIKHFEENGTTSLKIVCLILGALWDDLGYFFEDMRNE